MLMKLIDDLGQAAVSKGTLEVTMPDGRVRTFGDGSGDPVRITIHDPAVLRRMVISPELAVGEAYMDETLTIEDDDLRGFLALAVYNVAEGRKVWFQRPLNLLRRLTRNLRSLNGIGRARRNVAHHYDLSGKLYDLFLDADKQYSCAYFAEPGMSLEAAQAAKKRHIAKKLMLEPGMTVLDIGCGWGGMALTLARDFGARVVGVTLSEEQHRVATRRAREAGLEDRVDIRLADYRTLTETFDRIVSVGMFEHVGPSNYREYFGKVRDLLAPDGVALIHTIGRTDPPGITSPWIEKYIFPGGYIPSLSEIMGPVEKEALYLTDVEVWRLHYAETLKAWSERFTAHEAEAEALYDARFCRMWRWYLTASEMTFRYNNQCVFQVQLAHEQEAVPLTRTYLYETDVAEEIRHAAE